MGQQKPQDKNAALATWIGIGLALGAGVGVAIGNVALGIGIGLALGALYGGFIASRQQQ